MWGNGVQVVRLDEWKAERNLRSTLGKLRTTLHEMLSVAANFVDRDGSKLSEQSLSDVLLTVEKARRLSLVLDKFGELNSEEFNQSQRMIATFLIDLQTLKAVIDHRLVEISTRVED